MSLYKLRASLAPVLCVVAVLFSASPAIEAATLDRPIFWLAPPDDITQRGADFHDFFQHPEMWTTAARQMSTFSVTAPYLLLNVPEVAQRELAQLKSLGLKLDISIPALAADKRVCGSAIEGMIWPGELEITAAKLKALGADVDSFSFDLPLTSGHISKAEGACQFSISGTADRLAKEVHGLRKIYPMAKLVDAEVPTGMPSERWTRILSEWLDAFKRESGEDFYALSMDVWWKFSWQDNVRQTANILDAKGIRSGIFLNASAGPELTAAEWISSSKQNACALRDSGTRIDYIVVSNWLNMKVENLPETSPTTLTSLLDWAAAGMLCSH
jgi:hypothetical protein